MFKNSPSICYTFFAINDVIVTPINTFTSMMGISTSHWTQVLDQIFARK